MGKRKDKQREPKALANDSKSYLGDNVIKVARSEGLSETVITEVEEFARLNAKYGKLNILQIMLNLETLELKQQSENDLKVSMARLYELCVEAFNWKSVDSQYEHLEEEIGEYLVEKKRVSRGRSDEEKVLEETIDVFMCSFQMSAGHFGMERFNQMFQTKLKKFAKNIEMQKAEALK